MLVLAMWILLFPVLNENTSDCDALVSRRNHETRDGLDRLFNVQ